MAQPQLRRSQLVTTFGPGCMIDLPDSSVIVAGLDHWRYDSSRIPTIEEPRLVEKLRAGDVVIALGAGDINRSLERIAELLRENPPPPAEPARVPE